MIEYTLGHGRNNENLGENAKHSRLTCEMESMGVMETYVLVDVQCS
jgi:hypothetical protein